MRFPVAAIAIALCLALPVGCGQTGPLYLPGQSQPKPGIADETDEDLPPPEEPAGL